MKVLVIGAGVVGSIFGWAFTTGGQEVTHFVRQGRAGRFNNGLSMDVVDRRPHKQYTQEIYPLKATETLSSEDRFDLVIVPTKHYALEQTLQEIVPLTKGSDYLLLTQNWQGTEEIDHWIEPAHYCFGDAKAGGSFIDDELVCAIKAIDIGSSNGQTNTCLQKCISLFQSADTSRHTFKRICSIICGFNMPTQEDRGRCWYGQVASRSSTPIHMC